jgi:hypothetical protein
VLTLLEFFASRSKYHRQALDAFPLLVADIVLYQIEQPLRFQQLNAIIKQQKPLKPFLSTIFSISKQALQVFAHIPFEWLDKHHIARIDELSIIIAMMKPYKITPEVINHILFLDERIPKEYLRWFLTHYQGNLFKQKEPYQQLMHLSAQCNQRYYSDYIWFLIRGLGIQPIESMDAKESFKKALAWHENIDNVHSLLTAVIHKDTVLYNPFPSFSLTNFDKKLTITPIGSIGQLQHHANEMNHCGFYYAKPCVEGDSLLLSVHEDDVPYSTIELSTNDLSIIQHKGVYDCSIEDKKDLLVRLVITDIVNQIDQEAVMIGQQQLTDQQRQFPSQTVLRDYFYQYLPEIMPNYREKLVFFNN